MMLLMQIESLKQKHYEGMTAAMEAFNSQIEEMMSNAKVSNKQRKRDASYSLCPPTMLGRHQGMCAT